MDHLTGSKAAVFYWPHPSGKKRGGSLSRQAERPGAGGGGAGVAPAGVLGTTGIDGEGVGGEPAAGGLGTTGIDGEGAGGEPAAAAGAALLPDAWVGEVVWPGGVARVPTWTKRRSRPFRTYTGVPAAATAPRTGA